MRNLLLAIFACGSLLQAGLVLPSATWQNIEVPVSVNSQVITSDVNNNGSNIAYWNKDGDGGTCSNIGCFVTGTGLYNNGSTPGPDPAIANPVVWLGSNDGSAQSSFYFQGEPQGNITLEFELAGNAGKNWFGWYTVPANANDPVPFTTLNKGSHPTGKWDVIFNGDATYTPTKASVSFEPGQQFGFWFLPNFTTDENTSVQSIVDRLNGVGSRQAVFTQSGRNKNMTPAGANTAGVNNQYFTLFANSNDLVTPPTKFYMGIEDLRDFDFDYNDMIVSFTIVPEPGFYGALSLGLAGLYLAVRRRKA